MLRFLAFVACVSLTRASITMLSQTGWDAPFTKACGANSALAVVKSVHNNHREDRVFTFGCRSGIPVLSPTWTGLINNWDAAINHHCPPNQVMTGADSFHDNGKEDRRWKVRCSKLNNMRTVNCMSTRYVNNWDSPVSLTVPDNRVITGMISFHSNSKEDRLWMYYHCEIEAASKPVLSYTNLPSTNWDAPFNLGCPANKILYRIKSRHDNHREDRIWDYSCRSGYTLTNPTWTPNMNNWDGVLNYKCPSGKVVTGIGSFHSNQKEDRLWKVRCSQLDSTTTLSNCATTDFINDWDSLMFYSADSDRVIQGLFSQHSNTKEDRLWKVHHCAICSNKIVFGAWSEWSACSKPCASGTRTRKRSCSSTASAGLPSCAGVKCQEETETEKCNTQPCATTKPPKPTKTPKPPKEKETCDTVKGTCRAGKCPSGEKKAKLSKKKCKGVKVGDSSKPVRCCVKK